MLRWLLNRILRYIFERQKADVIFGTRCGAMVFDCRVYRFNEFPRGFVAVFSGGFIKSGFSEPLAGRVADFHDSVRIEHDLVARLQLPFFMFERLTVIEADNGSVMIKAFQSPVSV